MEEVKENTRASITSGLNRNTILNRPSAQPTVGAGGQYQVNVQAQPEGKFSKLAKGLSAFNTMLGALAESNVAAGNLAMQQQSEMTLEEIEENNKALKETEGKLYEQNSFIDRLTRKGKSSMLENPLTFSRAQRAAGARVGAEEYKNTVSKRMLEAQNNFKRNRVEYNVNDILTGAQDEIFQKYGMDQGSSIMRGFSDAASKFNSEARLRDFAVQDKIATAFREGDAAESIYAAVASAGTMKEAQWSLAENSKMMNDIGVDGGKRALAAATMKLVAENKLQAENLLASKMEGMLSGVKIGGVSIDSPVYESIWGQMDNMLDAADREEERENNISASEVKGEITNAVKAGLQKFPSGAKLSDLQAFSSVPLQGDPESMIPVEDFADVFAQGYIDSGRIGERDGFSAAYQGDEGVRARQARVKSERDGVIEDVARDAKRAEDGSFVKVSVRGKAVEQSLGNMDEATRTRLVTTQRSFINNMETVKADLMRGELPDGATLPKDEDGDDKEDDTTWTQDDIDKMYSQSLKFHEQKAMDDLARVVADSEAEARKESAKTMMSQDKDTIENTINQNYKENFSGLSKYTLTRNGISEEFVWTAAKADKNMPEASNYLIGIPTSEKQTTMRNLKAIVRDGQYDVSYYSKRRNRTVRESRTVGDDEIKSAKKLLDVLERHTPVSVESLREYDEGDRGEFPDRGVLIGGSKKLTTMPYEASTQEEFNYIVETVKRLSGDQSYSIETLKANQLKPITISK